MRRRIGTRLLRWLALCGLVATLLAFPGGADAAFPGVNGRIAFESTRDGNSEIYSMNADGSDQRRLTNNAWSDAQPAWSPDGTKIAFVSGGIHSMNADGSGDTQLAADGTDPAWSPDGAKIAFVSQRDGSAEIYSMNADGSGEIRLTSNSASDARPAWSPDGSKIVFDTDRDGNLGDGNFEIYAMNADGSGQTRLTNSSAVAEMEPAWSPDGSRIAFSRGSLADLNTIEIYAMSANGSGQVALTSNSVPDYSPAWSPDGTKVAFESERDGLPEIYSMNADGSAPARLTNNSAGDYAPDWGTKSRSYSFTGFLAPIDNTDAQGNYILNVTKAGASVPVRFGLGGDQGLSILAAGYPRSQAIACDPTLQTDGIEETASPGASTLSYDAASDTYTYVWKTDKAWAATCRQLVLKLADGSVHRADLKFKP